MGFVHRIHRFDCFCTVFRDLGELIDYKTSMIAD